MVSAPCLYFFDTIQWMELFTVHWQVVIVRAHDGQDSVMLLGRKKSWFEQRSDWKSTQLESAWCPDSSPFITWSETCDILAGQDWFDLFWKRRPEIKGLSIGGKPEKRRPCHCRCAKAGPGDPAADGGGKEHSRGLWASTNPCCLLPELRRSLTIAGV